jgi:hypothetical protein
MLYKENLLIPPKYPVFAAKNKDSSRYFLENKGFWFKDTLVCPNSWLPVSGDFLAKWSEIWIQSAPSQRVWCSGNTL